MIARPDSTDLLAAHSSSPSTTSPSVSGAYRMASHVRCTCMRENAEYIASKLADIIVLEATVPAARKAMYDTPSTWPTSRPRPKPMPNR